MKTHPIRVEKFDGTLEELAHMIHDLRYDARAKLLFLLAERRRQESKAESERARPQLAFRHLEASEHLRAAAEADRRAFKISERHMREELELVPPLL